MRHQTGSAFVIGGTTLKLGRIIREVSQKILRLNLASGVLLSIAAVAYGQTPAVSGEDVAVGERLIGGLCTPCHSVEANQPSPHEDAPSLTGLSRNYPVEALAESLAEGIMTGHPDMPVFTFDSASIDSIIAYLASIQDVAAN